MKGRIIGIAMLALSACQGLATLDGNPIGPGSSGGKMGTQTSVGPIGSGSGGGPGTPPTGSGGATGTDAGSTVQTGLPCDVQSVLAGRCVGCHGSVPIGGAPMSLVTVADLTTPSRSNPAMTNAQLSVARMQSPTLPMPPAPATAASPTDIATLQAWIAAGYPTGSCGGGSDGGVTPVPPDPYGTPTICTSNAFSRGGESATMDPGMPCISCHAASGGEAPTFAFAGTVYPSAHEPDQCNGANGLGGAQVVITMTGGRAVTLTPNAVGSFTYAGTVSLPYQAKVVFQGRERAMATPQTAGDCNSCHTLTGTNGAPGRIMLP